MHVGDSTLDAIISKPLSSNAFRLLIIECLEIFSAWTSIETSVYIPRPFLDLRLLPLSLRSSPSTFLTTFVLPAISLPLSSPFGSVLPYLDLESTIPFSPVYSLSRAIISPSNLYFSSRTSPFFYVWSISSYCSYQLPPLFSTYHLPCRKLGTSDYQ